jgi:hypothetical protein
MKLSSLLLILDRVFDHLDDILDFFFDLINALDIIQSLGNVCSLFNFKLILFSKLALSTINQKCKSIPAEKCEPYFEQ